MEEGQKFPIDLVVTYVDDRDPVWIAEKSKYFSQVSPKRYRNWDIMKYWFRGVETNMPFVRTVHFVVSNIEQVPEWLDKSKVNVVLHKDIIPSSLLPTFNSTTIEMFLHRINGLSEHFIYSNDDMMPMKKMSWLDFFNSEGKPIYQLIHRTNSKTSFRLQCRNSHALASSLVGKPVTREYFYIKHSMSPMLKSVFEYVHEKAGDKIMRVCTKFREPFNYTQYLFPDYAVLSGKAVLGNPSFRYVSLGDWNTVKEAIENCVWSVLCINDSGKTANIDLVGEQLRGLFEKRFGFKSRFEI